jgi:hypothetical protein
VLDGLDAWSKCYLHPRGRWPHAGPRLRERDRVFGVILEAAGVPADFDGAIGYDQADRDRLITALCAAMALGWSTRDDLFVIPDHAQQLVQTDHQGVVHVDFANGTDVDRFIAHMAKAD